MFQSPRESIEKYVGRQNPPFPLAPDPDRKVYDLYGVEASLGGFLKGAVHLADMVSALRSGFKPGKMEGRYTLVPADFLIGPELTVERVHYGRDITDHMPLEEIEAWLDSAGL